MGPGRSIIFQRPADKKSILVAFPGLDYQVEIYASQPAVTLATAESGKIQFVPG